MIDPTSSDIGRMVIYTGNRHPGGEMEQGVITSFNRSSVFVRYGSEIHSKGTNRSDLEWAHPSPAPGLYATDGLCHNANRGTFNHECGRPAEWIGENANGFRSGFCSNCKEHGDEAKEFTDWTPIPLPEGWTWAKVASARKRWDIADDMIPVARARGCVAWGTISSALAERQA